MSTHTRNLVETQTASFSWRAQGYLESSDLEEMVQKVRCASHVQPLARQKDVLCEQRQIRSAAATVAAEISKYGHIPSRVTFLSSPAAHWYCSLLSQGPIDPCRSNSMHQQHKVRPGQARANGHGMEEAADRGVSKTEGPPIGHKVCRAGLPRECEVKGGRPTPSIPRAKLRLSHHAELPH